MKNSLSDERYDFVIVGSGPIGAATAYMLSRRTRKKIALITRDPADDPDHRSTYLYAGGSVRWFWNHKRAEDRKRMTAMTKMTADFAGKAAASGVDLSLIEDRYVFLTTGTSAPSMNLSAAKLVKYFLDEAKKWGVALREKTELVGISRENDSYILTTSRGVLRARTVLLAVGALETKRFVPEARIEVEKRELCILNLPVDEARASFPHLIAPLPSVGRAGSSDPDAVAYIFIKKTPNGLRAVLGEEELVDHGTKSGGKDFLPALRRQGIEKVFPFLRGVKTEKVLWGFDAKHKFPQFDGDGRGLVAVTCGSAVRSCLAIAEEAADRLMRARDTT